MLDITLILPTPRNPRPALLKLFLRAAQTQTNITMKVAWERLIRFVATDGRTLYGEPILSSPGFDLGDTTEGTNLKAKVIQGDLYDTTGATRVTEEVVTVKKLLGPLAQSDVPILRCVGLNYAKHSESTRTPLRRAPRDTGVWSLTVDPGNSQSPRSRSNTASLPLHLLQALNNCGRPRVRCRDPGYCSR